MRVKNSKPKIVVVLGPTASGKSALAVRLAKLFNGEVISADSRQVYRGVDLGSDKVPHDRCQVSGFRFQEKDGCFYEGVRHHLIDVVSPKKTFTVTQYKKLAEKAIRDIIKRGKIPIIAGGTGLYIDTLINDWKLPRVKPNLKLREELEKKSAEELFLELKKLDPKRAVGIDRHNKRRLVRAIEIVMQTGKPVPYLSLIRANKRIVGREFLKIGIKVAPEELKKRIKKRTLKRLREGVIQEMEGLKKSGVSQKRLNDISLYYRWVGPFLDGEMNKLETLETIAVKIGQYAKRQMTWFKRDKSINWISRGSQADPIKNKDTLRALTVFNGARRLVEKFLR
ncbi:MAG: tRNA (adenosine(37)-N6)-dimethylallyltransferase MiaA [Candidatus Liptonbacteria bacterium]|nr:tRNA (adenosine(37)-N6)-dimethylallyltransferase MiaA [Candidatus Liptonbacteria bacterium]